MTNTSKPETTPSSATSPSDTTSPASSEPTERMPGSGARLFPNYMAAHRLRESGYQKPSHLLPGSDMPLMTDEERAIFNPAFRKR